MRVVVGSLLLLLAIVSGCASSGRVGALPSSTTTGPSADLVVIRPRHVVAMAVGYYVLLDGKEIFMIRSGQHTVIPIPTGEHKVGVKCFGGIFPKWHEKNRKITVSAGEKYFFKVAPDIVCADIDSIDKETAEKAMGETTFVSPQTESK